jgi:hypothetical protein
VKLMRFSPPRNRAASSSSDKLAYSVRKSIGGR